MPPNGHLDDKDAKTVLIPLNPALIAQYEEWRGLSCECLSLSDDCSYRPNCVMVTLKAYLIAQYHVLMCALGCKGIQSGLL